jgi:hypothetical protein
MKHTGVQRSGPLVISRSAHLSPNTDCIPDVVFAVRKLPDAVVDSNAAFARGEVFLCHLHPSQRAHSKTLEGKVRT